jgi:cell division protein FtsN
MRILGHSIAALALLAGMAAAQTVREIPGPRDLPPPDFRGAQFVDSQGCVFVRAGLDGQTIWVPRVNAQRKVLCGYPPTTFAASAPAVVPVKPKSVAPVAAPARTPTPIATPAKPVRVAEAGEARKKQANDYIDAPRAGSAPGTLRCPARAPIAERVPLATGGSVLLCVSRAGLVGSAAAVPEAAVSIPARTAGAAPAAKPSVKNPTRSAPLTITLTEPEDGIDLVKPVVPKGYKLAWKDDRLNANRAQGTPGGQAAQDLVWTRDTPARLVTRAERAKLREQGATLSVSTKGLAGKARFVQIGSFAEAANAKAAGARLSAIGLPVAVGTATSGGRKLQVVMAGPFAGEAEAKGALAAVRRAGFKDAVLR